MKLEVGGKIKKGSPKKSQEKCVKSDLAQFGLKQDVENQERHVQIKAKIVKPGLPGK